MSPPDPKQLHVVKDFEYTSPFVSCRFDPNGRFVFAGAEDRSVQRFDLASGNRVSLEAHDSWVRAIGFSPDGTKFYTGGYDGRLIFWPAEAEKPVPDGSIEAHRGWIRSLAVSPDGQTIATAGNDHLVKLWNAADGNFIAEFAGHESHIYYVMFHPTGQFLLSGDLKGQVKQWDVSTAQAVRTFDASPLHSFNGGQGVDYGGIRSLGMSADGKHLACSGLHKATNPLGAVNEPLVVLFDWESQKTVRSHVVSGVKGILWQVVYHSQLGLVGGSGGSGGGWIVFWQPDQDKEQFKFKMPNTVRDLDLHKDGLRIATAHHDKRIRLSSMAPKAKG